MVELFRADDRHYDQMYDLHKDCFLDEAMTQGIFMDEVENESRVYFVALDGDKVVGYAGAWNTGAIRFYKRNGFKMIFNRLGEAVMAIDLTK